MSPAESMSQVANTTFLRAPAASSFATFTARLAAELRSWRDRLDRLDAGIAELPPDCREQVRRLVVESEGPALFAYLDGQFRELEALQAGLDEEQRELLRAYFRAELQDLILAGDFARRTNTRPRGYAGDSTMMCWIYENELRGPSSFEMLMHKYPIEWAAAQAVRNRRGLIAEAARSWLSEARSEIRVLSVACGPAWELRDLLRTPAEAARFRFNLLDQDPEALAQARQGAADLEERLGVPLEVTTLQDSVRSLLKSAAPAEQWGQHHLIYSMGLFDYLEDRTAARLIAQLYEMLLPGGELIIGNYHVDNR